MSTADRSPRDNRGPSLPCSRVRRQVNDFIDGRLAAKERAMTQAHLRRCTSCMQEARDLARLARATHNLPPHRVGIDLADRVRVGLADRRSRALADLGTQAAAPRGAWHRAPGARPALAAAAVIVVWIAGFFAGRGVERFSAPAGESTPQRPAGSGHSPRREHAAAPPPSAIDPEFLSAGHEILADLEWASHLPPHVRRPMLASQFELFDLRQRSRLALEHTTAATPGRPLAQLVHDFGNTLLDRRAIDWHAWSSAARALRQALPAHVTPRQIGPEDSLRGIAPPARGDISEPHENVIANVMLQVGTDLSAPERRDLAELLHFKHLLVHDAENTRATTPPAVMTTFLSEWHSRVTSSSGKHGSTTSLRLATGVRALRTLRAAGRTTDAAEFASMVEHMARELGLAPPHELTGWR